MARFFAVIDAPNDTETRFREALTTMRKWRFDKRGWVIKAFCNEQAKRIYVDAEAPSRDRFAEWLQQSGLRTSQIEEVNLVFEGGLIWPMKAHAAV